MKLPQESIDHIYPRSRKVAHYSPTTSQSEGFFRFDVAQKGTKTVGSYLTFPVHVGQPLVLLWFLPKASPKKTQTKIMLKTRSVGFPTKKGPKNRMHARNPNLNPVFAKVFSIIFMQLTKDTPLEAKYFDRRNRWRKLLGIPFETAIFCIMGILALTPPPGSKITLEIRL